MQENSSSNNLNSEYLAGQGQQDPFISLFRRFPHLTTYRHNH